MELLSKFPLLKKLIVHNQPGFRPGYSCINQLYSFTCKIYESLNKEFEVKGVFLDISKAFDKQGHVSGNLLATVSGSLKDRKLGVVLNGKVPTWANINAEVPQRYIVGGICFFIYSNDLGNGL